MPAPLPIPKRAFFFKDFQAYIISASGTSNKTLRRIWRIDTTILAVEDRRTRKQTCLRAQLAITNPDGLSWGRIRVLTYTSPRITYRAMQSKILTE